MRLRGTALTPIPLPQAGEGARPSSSSPLGFTDSSSTFSRSALPDPCSPSRPSRCAVAYASLDRCARLRPLVSMIFGERVGRAAGSAHQRSWKQERRIGASRSSRSDRSAAEERRSRLTATGRCGPAGRKIHERGSPRAGVARKRGRHGVPPAPVQSSTILPHSPRRMVSKPARNSLAGRRWVITLRTSRPLCSIAIILCQVSNISRP